MNEPSEDHRKFFPTLPPPPPPPDMFTVLPPREKSDSNGSVVVVLVVIVVAVVLLFCWVLYKLYLHEKKKREDSKKNNVCKVEAVHNELKKSRSGKIADVPVYGPDMSTGSKSESAHNGQSKEVESVENDANSKAPDRNLKAGGFEEGPSRSKDEMTRNTRANKKGKL